MQYKYLPTYMIFIYTDFMLMWSDTCFSENHETVHSTKKHVQFINSQNER